MMQLDAIGEACPLPVIMTKKVIEKMPSGQLEVLVDNEIAVRNIEKYAKSAGCLFAYSQQGDHYAIILEKREAAIDLAAAPDKPVVSGKTVVVLSADTMGSGDDELGRILIKGFIFALTQLSELPDMVLLYNTGARLAVEGSAALSDLIALEQAGVKVMTCGTCLNHFGMADQLGVGEVTNMYSIVEEMRQAGRIMRP